EGALTGGNPDLHIRPEAVDPNTADVGSQAPLLPACSAIIGDNYVAASGSHDDVSVGLHRDERLLTEDSTATPTRTLIGAAVYPSGSSCQPTLGRDFNFAHPRVQD